jgi:hypothetical protein
VDDVLVEPEPEHRVAGRLAVEFLERAGGRDAVGLAERGAGRDVRGASLRWLGSSSTSPNRPTATAVPNASPAWRVKPSSFSPRHVQPVKLAPRTSAITPWFVFSPGTPMTRSSNG